MHWETIGGIAALLAIIGYVMKWGRATLRWLEGLARRSSTSVPRKTIRVVAHHQTPWWHMGSVGGKPAMQVASHWYVTNITDRPIFVLTARLVSPKTGGMVATRHHERNLYGTFPIAPGATTEMTVDFWIRKPVRNEGENFVGTIVLVDQFGNEHKVSNVAFEYS